ncbi:hypothetical protein [Acetobacter persici]|uniref:Uncharacterized protein n=1 Tax=Acetobacter persici TaxID=1076596 RepID=A0A1U9LJJ5_9PROT|nr:hypothetical protein [Acetobacter persici]AQT06577.1 hypothetical protein A0U91_16345 [Acetobacter persici]
MSRKTVSATERLKQLPAFFRGSDLTMRFGWDSRLASQYLHAWKSRGLIEGLGGHSDVYANTLFYPHIDWSRATLMAMPTAICIGIEPLRMAGWTTQIQQRPDIAVHQRRPHYKIAPYNVFPMPAVWMREVSDGLSIPPERGMMPALRPAWALADMVKREGWGGCGLDADDLDWDNLSREEWSDLRHACAVLSVDYDLEFSQACELAENWEPDTPSP